MGRPDFYALSVYQRLKGEMTRLLEPVLQGEGLTLLQGYVLLLLDRSGGLTVGALSQETGMSQGNTSNLCKRLERSGYLERARDFRDERVVTLSLTQGGRDTLERIRRRFARYGQLLDQLPQADRDAIQQGVEAAERAMDYLAEQIKGEQTQC